MEFIPAIDLIEGQCVRLIQGDFDRQITYGDPLETAEAIQAKGARWLHLVDLDAARSRSGPNRDVIRDICRTLHMRVEVGGGIRSISDAEELFDAGVTRVIIGTMAIDNPELVGQVAAMHSDGVAVGLDYRRRDGRREVAVQGWLEGSGKDLFEVLPALAERGASAVIATDISRDGTLEGPDLETLRMLLELGADHGIDVIASGGVASPLDLVNLRGLNFRGKELFGAISGRAVHDGRLDVGEAVRICRT
ncbi:MAG: 1-(5-phosphoribosyl)-5-[(5-phosphoribosylamino)methylideneamino] imidazole-4-carboxamide isomerase [Actinomycetota bacterium]|nr:MAG: 1-(5-phosphoribosyl)-5-[(5-phosphoribosylamino)methylideneamino] imidazole-4-carboxamide isomerase [Actinomycetota bacterium]